MAKIMSDEEKQIVIERREARKKESAKIKRFKHNMEIARTICALLAICMNSLVLSHLLGFW
jgi:hypothetical protein